MHSFWETVLCVDAIDYGGNVWPPYVVPRSANIFAPVLDNYGLRLAWVFGNQAPGGICPYYAKDNCHHCDIGAGEGIAFSVAANRHRLKWFMTHYAAILPEVAHLVIYNSGSVLNSREMDVRFLDELIAATNSLPAVSVISLDSREAFVTGRTLTRLIQLLSPKRCLRPIVGLESAADAIRNTLLRKRASRTVFERAVNVVSTTDQAFGGGRVGMDVNILVGGPGTTPGNCVADALSTFRYLAEQSRAANIDVNVNLNAYYPSARGLARFPEQPRCSTAAVIAAARAMVLLADHEQVRVPIFIGLQDEGHDQEPNQRLRELATVQEAFQRFNQLQDPTVLDDLQEEPGAGYVLSPR